MKPYNLHIAVYNVALFLGIVMGTDYLNMSVYFILITIRAIQQRQEN
jgi:hypothetical protein